MKGELGGEKGSMSEQSIRGGGGGRLKERELGERVTGSISGELGGLGEDEIERQKYVERCDGSD